MTKHIIPRDKGDKEAIENLRACSFDEIKQEVPQLLEWLQDGNWPVAGPVCDFLLPYINEIDTDIANVLKTQDEVWKYWILNWLIAGSDIVPSSTIMEEVTRIAENPTEGEIEEELHEAAVAIIKTLKS